MLQPVSALDNNYPFTIQGSLAAGGSIPPAGHYLGRSLNEDSDDVGEYLQYLKRLILLVATRSAYYRLRPYFGCFF